MCHLDCCSNFNKDNNDILSEDSESSESEEEGQYAQIEYSRYVCKTEAPRTKIEFPVKLKNCFIEHFSNPWDVYTELSTIGEGSYGIVKKVFLKSNPKTLRAMKIIPKENIIENSEAKTLIDEIGILKNLEHPNIMKLYECFNDKENVYIVSEYCDQGDLLGKMEKLGNLSEIVVKFLMSQILNAISYLHSNHVFHGDIKLENVMLYKTSLRESRNFSRINNDLKRSVKVQKEGGKSQLNKSFISKKSFKLIEDMENYEIKLIDFGCCKYFKKKRQNNFSGIIGTSIYCSPEVIDNLYDEKSDEWSCGILMYILLCGEPPFTGDSEEEIFENVKKGNLSFSQPQFDNVSDNCINLIKKLLRPNSKERISASKALKHPFFLEDYTPNNSKINTVDKNILQKLLKVKQLPSKFHEFIEAYLCFNFIEKDEEKKLTQVFRLFDHNKKNRLSKKDFKETFKASGVSYTDEQIDNLFHNLDSDGNNSIEYQEFLRGMCDKNCLYSDNNLENVFYSIDLDKKGFINADDIKKFVYKNEKLDEKMFLKYLRQIGMDLTSKMNFSQFVDIIRNQKLFNLNKEKENGKIEEEYEKNKEDNNVNREEHYS